jgi:hypothetical protein
MKNNKKLHPTGHSYTIMKQVCNLIPGHMVLNLAKEHGIDGQCRTFSEWSHVVALVVAQLTHAIGLNDVCDNLQMHRSALSTIRGATPPSRNNFSHANKIRSAGMAEDLYWTILGELQARSPTFAKGRCSGYLKRFKTAIHAVDSTTIQLVANCMDWAKHRRRKAAAKCHLRLNLQSFLPSCAVIDTAKHHDSKQAWAVCAGLKEGDIVIFGKAYVDFDHLADLYGRGVWWVTRAKDNMQYEVVRKLATTDNPRILSDEVIRLTGISTKREYPYEFRRVKALVEVDGKDMEMVFMTDHLEWSATSVLELYRCRWDIEVFFKEIKQTLQLADFLGQSANAVRWQVWIGLLVHLLLRYLAFLHSWSHSFTRIFTVVRSALWNRWCLRGLLEHYGTAGGHFRILAQPEQAYLPGFAQTGR